MIMLTTKEAIEKRRSIRKFKPIAVSDEIVKEVLEAARLAPSGCNAQPWRFRIEMDDEKKAALAQAAYRQDFIASAPAVLVCCADIRGYIDGTISGIQDLGRIGAVKGEIVEILVKRAKELKTVRIAEIGPRIAVNVAIAVEHMVLRMLDFGLGSCWIRLFDEEKIKALYGWNDDIHVIALLPFGYPDESPPPRKRRSIQEIRI